MTIQTSVVDSAPHDAQNSGPNDRTDSEVNPVISAISPQFADDTLALTFSKLHADNLRFTAAWGKWSIWDSFRWRRDDTMRVFDLARCVCRSASSTCRDEYLAIRVASAPTVAAVERLARADRRHAATVDQWDADPWSLNTPAGVVDLRTSVIRPAMREDYCTKITTVAPGGPCTLWLEFLRRITNGDVEMQRFLQRICGYALTGDTRENALFFLYGTGANGKTVFISTISGVFGDYAKTAPIEAFIVSQSDRHPTDLAGLQGARLVTAIETEEGRRWAESKLKAITGGDRIAARFMRQDFFEYSPQFKLLIAGDHKPSIRTVDEAMRRRFNLLPFTVTIPKKDRDPKLTEKLRAEWGGILQWAIEGCRAWQQEGLNPPSIVTEATSDYLADEDTLGRWLEERCNLGKQNSATIAELFGDWSKWCGDNGEHRGSQKSFSQNLEARGFTRVRSAGARGFRGLDLNYSDWVDPSDSKACAQRKVVGIPVTLVTDSKV
jgi:putative DNA primase/helicase